MLNMLQCDIIKIRFRIVQTEFVLLEPSAESADTVVIVRAVVVTSFPASVLKTVLKGGLDHHAKEVRCIQNNIQGSLSVSLCILTICNFSYVPLESSIGMSR